MQVVPLVSPVFGQTGPDAALIELLQPPGLVCGDSLSEIRVVIQNQGNAMMTGLPITVNYSGGLSGTLNQTWSGALAPGGYDTVLVGTINTYAGAMNLVFDGWVAMAGDPNSANDTVNPLDTLTFVPVIPVGIAQSACGTDSATLRGQNWPGVDYNWYTSPTASIPLATGLSFYVSSLSVQSTYYMEYASQYADSLPTTYNGSDSCGGGNMFDLTAISTVTLTGLCLNTYTPNGNNFTFSLYYIPNGTYTGNETNAAAWTQLGTWNATSAGPGNPTFVTFQGASLTIPATRTYAIYVEYPGLASAGASTYSNADLIMQTGVCLPAIFSSPRFPYTFNGCVQYGLAGCSTVRVPVSAYPGQPMAVNLGPDTTYCATGVTLDAGANGASYSWNTGATSQMLTVNTSGTYMAQVTDTAGCSGRDTVNVTLFPPISVNLGADITHCGSGPVSLDAGNPGATYTWSTGASTQTIFVMTTGTYYVDVISPNGCLASDTINVSVGVFPSAAFSAAPQGNGLSWSFSDASIGATSWAWDFGDGSGSSTLQNPGYTYAVPGTYTVTLHATSPCGTDTATQPLLVVGEEAALQGFQIRPYPNPSDGRFVLAIDAATATVCEIGIFNLHGQQVLQRRVESPAATLREDIVLDVPTGIYYLQVKMAGKRAIRKIFIE